MVWFSSQHGGSHHKLFGELVAAALTAPLLYLPRVLSSVCAAQGGMNTASPGTPFAVIAMVMVTLAS